MYKYLTLFILLLACGDVEQHMEVSAVRTCERNTNVCQPYFAVFPGPWGEHNCFEYVDMLCATYEATIEKAYKSCKALKTQKARDSCAQDTANAVKDMSRLECVKIWILCPGCMDNRTKGIK